MPLYKLTKKFIAIFCVTFLIIIYWNFNVENVNFLFKLSFQRIGHGFGPATKNEQKMTNTHSSDDLQQITDFHIYILTFINILIFILLGPLLGFGYTYWKQKNDDDGGNGKRLTNVDMIYLDLLKETVNKRKRK